MNSDHIPILDARCNSWIVTRKGSGEVIGEFYSRRIVERFNPAIVLIETAAQYLGRINTIIRKQGANDEYSIYRY